MGVKKHIKRIRNYYKIKKLIDIGVTVGENCRIFCEPSNFGSEPYLIKIGNHCTIASGVRFITHDGGTWVFREKTEYSKINKYGKIDIKENCFIGMNAIILPNITIGPNSVVGAGSVVTKDIPPNVCAAGNPARIICSLDDYIEKSKAKTIQFPQKYRSKREVLEKYFWG